MSLTNRIFNYLSGKQNRAGTEPELCSLFFNHVPRGTNISHTLLHNILKPDGRFSFDENNQLWYASDDVLSMALNKAEFCVVDIETTGFHKQYDRIIEIAGVKIIEKEIYSKLDVLINPNRTIPANIKQLTGLSEELLIDKPHFTHIIPSLTDFLGDSVIVAHHSDFDIGFINSHLTQYGYQTIQNPVICTCKLARKVYPRLQSYSLDSLAEFLGFEFSARHRAYDDAYVTAHLFINLLDKLKSIGITTLKDLKYFL